MHIFTRRAALRGTAVASAVAVAVALFPAALPAAAATGTPIVYQESASATGTFGGTAFTNAQVTMKMSSNTADVINQGTGFPQNRTGTVTVSVAGLGAATVTYGTAYVNQNQALYGTGVFGFNGAGGSNFAMGNKALLSYNLDRPFGPVTGPSYSNTNRGFQTSNGGLILKSVGTVTFQAFTPQG